jgi:reductive dehalogenase
MSGTRIELEKEEEMSNFHSTVSRRNFMKGLGLAGAGLGAAAATAPVFNDLDEVASSPMANFSHPWYVKERDFKNPTTETDWGLLKAWSTGDYLKPRGTSIIGYAPITAEDQQGVDHWNEIYSSQSDAASNALKAGEAGFTLKSFALTGGARAHGLNDDQMGGPWAWDGGQVLTPEMQGVANWTGTPDEATNMVRAAAHFLGTPKIGVVELDSDTRKITAPKFCTFEDVDVAYMSEAVPNFDGRTQGRKVIPNKCRWLISCVVLQPPEMTKRTKYGLRDPWSIMGPGVGYANGPIILKRIQDFIRGLGYQALTDMVVTTGGEAWGRQNVPFGILSGTGELARHTMQITPEWGPLIRYSPGIITDLPMAPTKPIDAGIFEFCKACKICAEVCDEVNGWTPLSLETEPTWEPTGPWNRTGYKGFQISWARCAFCPFCQGACPFSSHNLSNIHQIVRAIVANTPIFNSFFTTMEHTFGYGRHADSEKWDDWWDRDLNSWKYDDIWGSGNV